MADDASMIFFRSAGFDLDAAAAALADRGLSVRRTNDELTVGFPGGPQLRVAYVQEEYVQEEAEEIGAGSPHAAAMGQCDTRFEILIDDLEAALDEINTLIDVQATLQDATQGFLFNTWNGELAGPFRESAEPGAPADRPGE
jgi:hypothetical protein